MNRKPRVLVVEDSDVVREFLCDIIQSDGRLELAGAVATAEEALAGLSRFAPDVISLDIRLPGIDGLEATRRIMSEQPTPIVVVAGSVNSTDLSIAVRALRCGALAVMEKPPGDAHEDFDRIARDLCTQLLIMSQVKVVRQWNQPAPRAGSAGQTRAASPPLQRNAKNLLAIGCSTGGPQALATVLTELTASVDVPILLVQHMPPAFVESFASWLQSVTPFQVVVVKEPQTPVAGVVYVAAPDRHLIMEGGKVRSTSANLHKHQRPSADVLFNSVVHTYGSDAVGLLLTGMGEDGAAGLLNMRKAGAFTIAEAETTAVVYGMPGAAVQRGAVSESIPLPLIGARLRQLLSVKEANNG